ncbi:MAG: 2-polyprenylphenol 6-hydroxylase [Pseudomonadota bacterium]
MFRALRNLGRIARIALTLARHDALIGLDRLAPPFMVRMAQALRRERIAGRPGQRLAAALTALGPSFIKFGQGLSTRADLVGEEIAADLSELQDRLAPFPGAAARARVAAELGRPIEEVFADFDDRAVAAASIAQVHLATARGPAGAPGTEVAVKVLRPGIESLFERDIDLFRWLAELAERLIPRLRRLKPVAVVAAFAETVRLEMDLRLEAAAASELGQNFAGDADFRVPRVDWHRTARRVLTLERISGISVDEREALLAAGHDPDAIVAKAGRAFFNQVFRDGFFHADLHPGNLFVADDGALVAVDFGIMGRLDRPTRAYLADMLLGFLNGDYARVAAVHFEAGFVPPTHSLGAFTQACRAIAEPILGRPMHEISLARLLAQLFEVTEAFEMETQPRLLLLQKSMLVCEGVGRRLNPNLNMWQLARPLVEAWMVDNRGLDARVRGAAEQAIQRLEELPGLVGNLEKAAAMLASGGVRLHPDSLVALRPRRERGAWPWIALALAAGFGLATLL